MGSANWCGDFVFVRLAGRKLVDLEYLYRDKYADMKKILPLILAAVAVWLLFTEQERYEMKMKG